MSSEEEVRALIARKTETKNLDYKETTDWSGGIDEKLELVKDVLAMEFRDVSPIHRFT